jgi:hypothetical protein
MLVKPEDSYEPQEDENKEQIEQTEEGNNLDLTK